MITVIGSVNMDLITSTKQHPAIGETVLGERFAISPGGKGANQATAVARLGEHVQLVGRIGKDEFGRAIYEQLHQESVNVDDVRAVEEHTGIASITVQNNDNSIIVVPGANFTWAATDAEAYRSVIKNATTLLLQLEVPIPFVEEVVRIAWEEKTTTILNPAPAQRLPEKMIDRVDYLTPNELECKALFNLAAEEAVEKYPNKLIVTKGKDGAMFHDGNERIIVSSFRTNGVDSTGAGDTFNGAFAVALNTDQTLRECIAFANAAASLSIEKSGAQAGMPTATQVWERLGTK
ncbi:ribokinase [Geomicrobium sp. JSM 1781026]|uniref:ribokinase n=1 Tax=Geomicrobium sp. JSM 1781026 TaxID=3344580 RepID=UPI0035BF71B8